MTTKTLKRPLKTSGSFSSSSLLATVIVVLYLITSVNCVKYSSKYNQNQFNQNKRDTIKTKYNSYTNDVKNNKELMGKLITNLYNYITAENVFVESRKNISPDYKIPVEGKKIDRIKSKLWMKKIADCVENKGIMDCMKIFLLRRVDRVNELTKTSNDNVTIVFDDLIDEIQKDFIWEKYKNYKDFDLDSLMMKKIRDLVSKQGLRLVLRPGVVVDIAPHSNGSVRLDISEDADVTVPRGMKTKIKKYAYRIVPFVLLPTLIFSSFLPFILPALKLMVLGAGLLNNMALTGAIFTLVRNNIFNDKYEKKVVYLNSGYKNEFRPLRYPKPFTDSIDKFPVVSGKYPLFTTPKYNEFNSDFNNDFSSDFSHDFNNDDFNDGFHEAYSHVGTDFDSPEIGSDEHFHHFDSHKFQIRQEIKKRLVTEDPPIDTDDPKTNRFKYLSNIKQWIPEDPEKDDYKRDEKIGQGFRKKTRKPVENPVDRSNRQKNNENNLNFMQQSPYYG